MGNRSLGMLSHAADLRALVRILNLLTALFGLRVLGQFLVAGFHVAFLPAMHHWQSGLLPYPVLLAIQLLMLTGMCKINHDCANNRGFFAVRRPRWSRGLLVLSSVYALAMGLRYGLTMYYYPEMRWLGDVIPILFHFVLAGYLYTLARYNASA